MADKLGTASHSCTKKDQTPWINSANALMILRISLEQTDRCMKLTGQDPSFPMSPKSSSEQSQVDCQSTLALSNQQYLCILTRPTPFSDNQSRTISVTVVPVENLSQSCLFLVEVQKRILAF